MDIYFFYKFCNEIGVPWLFWVANGVGIVLFILFTGATLYSFFKD